MHTRAGAFATVGALVIALVLSMQIEPSVVKRSPHSYIVRADPESWGTVLDTRSMSPQGTALVKRDRGDVVLIYTDGVSSLREGERVNTNHFRPFRRAQQIERAVST